MKPLLAFFFVSCAAPAVFTPLGEGQPRKYAARLTGCEDTDMTLRDYSASESEEHWVALCHGRTFKCARSLASESCTLDEKAGSGWISPETLVRRHNACVGENQLAECHTLAQDYEYGSNGVPPDRYAAIELYTHACTLGSQNDCRRSQALKRVR